MKTNANCLVKISVQGQISPPLKRYNFTVSHEGIPMILPGTGGITYNVKIGDRAMGWIGDHVEPGVSMKVPGGNEKVAENGGLNLLSCVGNKAKIISGDAKGDEGYVTGKHGGIEHVLIAFPEETLEKLIIGDKILIKAWGQGLKIEGLPQVTVMNLDPGLLGKIPAEKDGDTLKVPVVGTIPPALMGSGLGAPQAYSGDYDLTTADTETIKELGLANLRFGDLVAITDTDNRYGRCYRKGAVTIGVVVHSDCVLAGHGPGITTLFTSASGNIKPVQVEKANIGDYLGIT